MVQDIYTTKMCWCDYSRRYWTLSLFLQYKHKWKIKPYISRMLYSVSKKHIELTNKMSF